MNFQNVLKESSVRLGALAEDLKFIELLEEAGDLLVEALSGGKTLYACGNGGSMSDAMHFAEEFTGRYRGNRPPLRAVAISDPGYLSCVANDYGYENVFSRFLEAFAVDGDVLFAITTSGKSPNVLEAAKQMRLSGGKVIGLTGDKGTSIESLSDVTLAVGSSAWADRIQESHIVIIHSLVEYVEAKLGFPSQK